MKVYLAGPMRGYPAYNFPAFHAAAKELRERGHEVWSPAERDEQDDSFNPNKNGEHPKGLRYYMRFDLPAVLDADAVVLLPGWEKSVGANLEVHVAKTCGIPVYDIATVLAEQPLEGLNLTT
jgi:nucleoside 2-deoxyribosyltransferase